MITRLIGSSRSARLASPYMAAQPTQPRSPRIISQTFTPNWCQHARLSSCGPAPEANRERAMIHDLIREATHTSHRRLDLALSWLDLSKPRYYARFLRGQGEALFPIEAALELNGIAQILPDWDFRARSAA